MANIATMTVDEEMTCGTSYTATITKPSSTPPLTIILSQTVRGVTTKLLQSSSATSYTFNFSTSLFDPSTYGIEAARETSIPATLTLETVLLYNNIQRYIGSETYDITIKVPMENPTVSNTNYRSDYVTDGIDPNFLAAERASGLKFKNGLTKFIGTMTATPQNYAYISSIYLTGGATGVVYSDPNGENSGAVTITNFEAPIYDVWFGTGAYEVGFNIVDSRGNYRYSRFFSVLFDIVAPTLTNISWERGVYSNGNWTRSDINGTAIKMTATLTSQSGSANLKFSKNGSEITTSSYNSGTVTYYFTGCPPTANTDLLVEVDNYLAQSSYSYLAAITKPDINYNPDLPGIAFGKVADEANTIDSEWGIKTAGIMQAQYVDVTNTTANSSQTRYRFSDKDNAICGNAYVAFASGGGGRFYFREHSANSSGQMLSYYEQYRLPTPDGNRSSNASYDILTTKNDGQLTLTYTSNTYVSSTAFNRLYAYRRGNILIVRGNLQITTAMPSSNSAYTIGSISGWNGAYEVDLTVPAQDGSGTLLVIITTAGNINIYNTSGKTIAANAFCRFNVAVPVS